MGDGAVGEPGSDPLGRRLTGIEELPWVAGWLRGGMVLAGGGAPLSPGVAMGSALAGSVEGSSLVADGVGAGQGGLAHAPAGGAVWARASGALSSVIMAPPALGI